jgi:alpha-N-arabinofuranosidase
LPARRLIAILSGKDMKPLKRFCSTAGMPFFALSTLLVFGLSLTTAVRAVEPVTSLSLSIAADQPVARISPMLYGMMTEEINHSYDGGLYAELVQNRIFKDDPGYPVHWSVVQDNGAAATISLDDANPLNSNLATSLRLQVTAASANARAGVANDGYWGIPVLAQTRYKASFYARAAAGFTGNVTIAIESNDGTTIYAHAGISQLAGDWRKYTVTMKTGRVTPTDKARLVLSVNRPGTIWLNLVSLFPPTWHNRPNGNRVDLMQKLADMKPAFLRFPGGNFLEGSGIADRFPWKETLGDLTNRPGHPGCWGYRASDGLGLLEFLEWAGDLNAQPVLAVYAGFSLPPKADLIKPGADLEPYVQDALDEIEYVTSDPSTPWGARRAADGHRAPFKLTYVEIGNEDFFDNSGSYDARFAQFYDAIKAKYPDLQCISTVGNEQPGSKRVHSRKPDVLDEHYYRSAEDFEEEAPVRFERYDRHGPKIFVGEWGAYENIVPWDNRSASLPPTSSMRAALGDAAWMTAMERNADIIVMNCYAPMLVNVNPGGRQWRPDLIGYDALTSFGSPSYYAFKMFSRCHGDVVLKTTLDGLPASKIAPLDYSVTGDTTTGVIYVKMVNITETPQPVNLSLNGLSYLASKGTVVTLAGDPDETNSIKDPVHLVPVTSKISGVKPSFVYTFAPHSITVLELGTR